MSKEITKPKIQDDARYTELINRLESNFSYEDGKFILSVIRSGDKEYGKILCRIGGKKRKECEFEFICTNDGTSRIGDIKHSRKITSGNIPDTAKKFYAYCNRVLDNITNISSILGACLFADVYIRNNFRGIIDPRLNYKPLSLFHSVNLNKHRLEIYSNVRYSGTFTNQKLMIEISVLRTGMGTKKISLNNFLKLQEKELLELLGLPQISV